MTKTFEAKAGDRWTRLGRHLCLYRGLDVFVFNNRGHSLDDPPCRASDRNPLETDLPTPDAHAQLREWGYEVRGDAEEPSRPTVLHLGWYSDILDTSNWAGPEFNPPLTESRVIEIVNNVLAKRSHTGHYSHAVDDARVREIVAGMLAEQVKPAPTPDDWRAKCRELQAALSILRDKGKQFYNSEAPEGAEFRAIMGFVYDTANNALAKAPPPPDVAEPDWKGLLEELVNEIDRVAPCWNDMWASSALAAAWKAVGK